MTKTCLRLLFLAALAAPLAHGCSDSSLECLGQPVACENREISSCTHGCRVTSGCVGGEITCESLTDRPMLCVQTGNCLTSTSTCAVGRACFDCQIGLAAPAIAHFACPQVEVSSSFCTLPMPACP